LAHVTLYSTIN